MGEEAPKISALSSKNLLEKYKYEYLTGEDLGHRPSVLQKNRFEYSPLGMSLNKSFKKDNVKNIAKSEGESDFNYDEFAEMPLDSKYNKINKFTNLFTKFKNIKPKKNRNTTQKRANYEKCG